MIISPWFYIQACEIPPEFAWKYKIGHRSLNKYKVRYTVIEMQTYKFDVIRQKLL